MHYWRFGGGRFEPDDVERDDDETLNAFVQRLGYIVSTDQEGKDVQVYIARAHLSDVGHPLFFVVHLVAGKAFYTRVGTYPDLLHVLSLASQL